MTTTTTSERTELGGRPAAFSEVSLDTDENPRSWRGTARGLGLIARLWIYGWWLNHLARALWDGISPFWNP